VCRDPQEAYRFEVSLAVTTIQNSLQKRLGLHAYNAELKREMKVTEQPKPVAFANFTLSETDESEGNF
jgi:hypothetical protein